VCVKSKEHQCAPFLLHSSQRVASPPHHKCNTVIRNFHNSEVLTDLVQIDVNFANPLVANVLNVVLRALALDLGALDLNLGSCIIEVQFGLTHASNLPLRCATSSKHESGVFVANIYAVRVRIIFHAVAALITAVIPVAIATPLVSIPRPG
jgi:hypothetical protein